MKQNTTQNLAPKESRSRKDCPWCYLYRQNKAEKCDECEKVFCQKMTADTITVSRLNDLAAILEVATETVWRMHTEAVAGTISPAEAAEIINETIQTIKKSAE